MIIKKTEILIDLDNVLPEELQLQSFSKKIIPKAVKKASRKRKKGHSVRWTNFHGQKNLLNLEINHGSEKSKREPPQV